MESEAHGRERSLLGRRKAMAPRSPLVQHGHPFLLHAAVRSQADWFEGAEENQGEYHVLSGIAHPTSGAQGAIEEEKRSRVPKITTTADIKVSNRIKIL